MLTREQTVVLRSIAALKREDPKRVRSVSAIAKAAARRGEAHTDETVKKRVDDLIEEDCVEAIQLQPEHSQYQHRGGKRPREYSVTKVGWIVGFERCKALIQDFGADPADLFEIDDIVTENWV